MNFKGYVNYKDNEGLEVILNKEGCSTEFDKEFEEDGETFVYKHFDADAFWNEALNSEWTPDHHAEVRINGRNFVVVENITDWDD